MKLRHIRHATMQIEFAGRQLLVDPMFAKPRRFPSLTLGRTAARNPLVDLPCPLEELLQPAVVLATHSHFDHVDRKAVGSLSKTIPILCQSADEARFKAWGFRTVMPISEEGIRWNGIRLFRINGCHGHGLIGRLMGTVSGFVLQADGEPTVYIAGDTVFCDYVGLALDTYKPDIVVVNAGAARFNFGRPITMDVQDIVAVCRAAPQAKVVAVHMEAVNHCRLKRGELTGQLKKVGLKNQVVIPADGETWEL